MDCPTCKVKMEWIGYTYRDSYLPRGKTGDHNNGSLYKCKNCNNDYLYSFLREKLESRAW